LKVPFFDYSRAYTDDRADIMRIIDTVAGRGGFILQKELEDFENNLAEFCGAERAIGVANATDGLELAWMTAGLKPGDEVICSAHTMLATASSIVVAGGIPVPVDIEQDGLINPDAVSDAINSRTRGIMPTQLNGRVCRMDKLMDIAKKNDLLVVEDCAQALGAKYDNKNAGTFGFASAISFYPAKVLGCLGDGGAIIVNEPELYQTLYELHDHGRGLDGKVKRWGRNSRLDNIQAAILDFRLKTYDTVIYRRRSIAGLYQSRLGEIEELQLPKGPSLTDVNFDIFQNYEILATRRDELKCYLRERGVGSLIQWGGEALSQIGELGMTAYLPATEDYFKRCLMLPMNCFLDDDNVHYVCDVISDFYRS